MRKQEEEKKSHIMSPAHHAAADDSAKPNPSVLVSKRTAATTPFKKPYYTTTPDLSPLLYCDVTPSLERYSVADICFVCDITGSMDEYIAAVRRALQGFMGDVHNMMSLNPRFSFIGFRDKSDPEQIVKKDFTTDVGAIEKFIADVKCDGGGDFCEDLVTPMKEALKLEWRSDLSFVFMVLDAPTHGKRYYKAELEKKHFNFDADADADKEELLEKLCCHYRKKKINLVVFKCSNTVDQMIGIMSQFYNSEYSTLQTVDISADNKGLMSKLGIDMNQPMTAAFESTVRRNFHKITKARVDSLIKVDPELTREYVFEGKIYSGSFGSQPQFKDQKYAYDLKVEASTIDKFAISSAKLGIGAYKECYLLKSVAHPEEKYVAKIPIKPAEKPEDLLEDIEGCIFAQLMEMLLTTLVKRAIVRVLPTVIIEVPEEAQKQPIFKGSKYIIAQKYLEGEYKKYNNNYGWVLREDSDCNKLAQALSHFTYEASMGTLLIVDIQGVDMESDFYITDPAIHSMMYKNHFGEANCGKLGITKFFASHQCNEHCRDLKLTDPRKLKKDDLARVLAKHAGDKGGLVHLYGKFEKEFEEWAKSIRAFDPRLPPEKSQPVEPPAKGNMLMHAEFNAGKDVIHI